MQDVKCKLHECASMCFFSPCFFFFNVLSFFFTLSFKENAREYLKVVSKKNSHLPLINRGALECQRPGRLDETSLSSSRFYSRSSQREPVCKYNKRFPRAASKRNSFVPLLPGWRERASPAKAFALIEKAKRAHTQTHTQQSWGYKLEVVSLQLVALILQTWQHGLRGRQEAAAPDDTQRANCRVWRRMIVCHQRVSPSYTAR